MIRAAAPDQAPAGHDDLAGLLGRAYDATDLADVTEHVLSVLAGARQAGLDERITAGLNRAAVALGAPPLAIYRAGRDPAAQGSGHADDTCFLEDLAAAADEIADQLGDIAAIAGKAAADRAAAESYQAAAERALTAAQAMPVTWPCTGCHAARDDTETRARAAADDAACGSPRARTSSP